MKPHDPADLRMEPGRDLHSGKAAAVVATCGLFVDSLMLAAVRKRYDAVTDLFYPWFFFYAALILGLVALGTTHTMRLDSTHIMSCMWTGPFSFHCEFRCLRV